MLWGAGALDGAFLCECARAYRIEEVPMTLPEYVRLRDRDEVLFARHHEGSVAENLSDVSKRRTVGRPFVIAPMEETSCVRPSYSL